MPRTSRPAPGGFCYHVLNRGNAGRTVFRKPADYATFVELLAAAPERTPMRFLAWCLMPSHFHLVLWPSADGELSRYMMWLMTAQVRRYHRDHRSSGHIWQGRFKSFPIQKGDHLFAVMRHVEGNPVRAGLAARAEEWSWSSAVKHRAGRPELDAGPAARPRQWLRSVNQSRRERELQQISACIQRGRPFGEPTWTRRTASALGLESSLRPRGRPRKEERDDPA